MSLFVANQSSVLQPGVFLIEVAPPTIIDGVSNGFVGLVFQGEWGPVNVLYVPTSGGDMLNNYFPAGSPHNSTGYYAVMRRKAMPWAMVRILGGTQGLLPPTITSITQGGTSGATSYSYTVTAVNAAGETMASAVFTTATGNATLTSLNDNIISWSSVTGAVSYNVYRTASGGTPSSTGKINSSAVLTTTFNDTGLSASGASPTLNGSGWETAICNLLDSSGTAVMQLVAKFGGSNGNLFTAQVSNASDGVANHFNLVVTWSNAVTGSTAETYANLQTQATAILPNVASSLLLGSTALINTPTTRPANGSYTFYNGSNGATVSANDYNNGFTQLATNNLISWVCVDDCGDTIRAAVNTDLQAHVDSQSNRIGVIQGSPLNNLSAVLTDVANYRDDRILYCGSWVTSLDDTGTPQQSPFATFIASAGTNLEPQQSHAWWDDRATTYYTGIFSIPNTVLNTNDDTVKNQCTLAGVQLPTRLDSGKYAALHDRTASLTSGKTFTVTRRIKDYLAKNIKQALPGFVNGPNTVDQQRLIVGALNDFLQREQIKGRIAPNAADPTKPGFQVDGKTGNTTSSIALGQYVVLINAVTPSPMEKIFILLNVGPNITITAQ